MNDNICGNCDYCNTSRVKDGKVRCKRYSAYVDIEGVCHEYFNAKKSQIYNQLLDVLDNIKE